MKFSRFFLLLIAVFFSNQILSMNPGKTDSLYQALKIAREDTNKVNILLDIARQTFGIDNKTSSEKAYQAYKLSRKLNFYTGEAAALNILGVCQYLTGDLDSAEVCYINALTLAEKHNLNNINIKATGNLGLVYTNKGEYDKAIVYLNKALKLNEANNDSASIARNCADIASIYTYTNKYDLSVSYNERALEIFRVLGMRQGEANVLNSLGTMYNDSKNYSKAMSYFKQSAEIKDSIGDRKGLATTLHNIGLLYSNMNKNDSSLIVLEKSLSINHEIDNKDGIANDNICIGALYMDKRDYKKAIEYLLSSYNLSQKQGFMILKKTAVMDLSQCYDSLGDYKNALLYFRKYKYISDSLKSVDIEKKISEVEGLYQNEKKQKEIEILEKDKALQKTEVERQKVQKYAFIGGFVLMLVIAFLSVLSYRKIKGQKHIIEEKNEELNQQNDEIRAQRDEIEAQRDEISGQRDLVTIQRDEIKEQKLKITDSINYAKRIQQAVLPSGENALNILGEHFILFKPKDIVSGDFYWAARINEWLIVTAADCTGHGVPGAFMSMLGVSYLNEIVRKKEVTKASEVLDYLRESIIDALQQKGSSGEQKDGMDIALCVLNTNTNILQFAGANNSLYIVKNSENRQLIEIKGDKQPVAIHVRMSPFTNHEIQMSSGDCIYLASDGYEDQFGGEKGRKFMSKKLKEMFLEISTNPMSEQCQILNSTFDVWKGTQEQVDDVTVLGMKVE